MSNDAAARSELTPRFVAQIKVAVLADHAPDIIEIINRTLREESERLMREWMDSPERQAENRAETEAQAKGPREWKEWEASQVTPRWISWSYLGHSLDYVVRDMREKIAQRDMTRGEIDATRKQQEIERKERELAQLRKT